MQYGGAPTQPTYIHHNNRIAALGLTRCFCDGAQLPAPGTLTGVFKGTLARRFVVHTKHGYDKR